MSYSEREELISIISDVSKDAYGSRTRKNYSNFSIEDLKSELDYLSEYADFVFNEEKKLQESNFEHLLQTIQKVQNTCNCSARNALHYLMDAEDCNRNDFSYFCYLYNIPYGKKTELQSL